MNKEGSRHILTISEEEMKQLIELNESEDIEMIIGHHIFKTVSEISPIPSCLLSSFPAHKKVDKSDKKSNSKNQNHE